MIAALIALIPLITLIFKEFFSAQSRARAANQAFVLDQATFQKIVTNALNQQLMRMALDSQGVGSAQDAADNDAKKSKTSDPAL